MDLEQYASTLNNFCRIKKNQSHCRFFAMLLCITCSIVLLYCLGEDLSGRLILTHELLFFGVLLLSFSSVCFLSWLDLRILQQQLHSAFYFGLQFEKEHTPARKPLHSVQDLLNKNPRTKRYRVWLYTLSVGLLGFLLGLFSVIWIAEISKVLAVILISIASIGIYGICKQIFRVETSI